jgi:hypothetical protein
MATSPPMIGGSDPSVLRSLETPTPSVARTSPPTVSASTGSATSGGTAVARGIAPQVSGATTTYNQATQTASGTSLTITSATSNEPADVVTVYNTNKAISVSAVNQTVNSYKVNNYAGNEYTDSNVAAYLPTFTGNVGAGNVNVTGTVYTSGISSTGSASLTILNVSTTANLGAVGNIIITGGTAGQVLSTNGSGVLSWASDATTYGNSNVVTLMSAFGSNTISTTGNITGGNIIGIIAAGSNTITTTGNITGGNINIPNGNANVTGTANTVGGGATVGVRSILAIDSAFGSNDANDPASAQAVRGRVTGSNLTKTRNYVTGVTGQYLVTGTNASEFINTGLLGVVGDQTTTANAAVVAYLDGDGGLTTAGSAYGVSMKNSTPGSGFDYGLDLQFIDLNVAGTTTPFKQADIRFNNGVELVANTANNISINANVTVGNIIATNIGNIATINLDGNLSNILYGNGVFASAPAGGGYGNSNVATFLASYGSNTMTTTGNVSVGNIIGNGQALTGLAGANVSGFVPNANVANTAFAVAASNVSGLGNIATINLDGNLSNILYGNGVFASAPAGGTYGDSNVVTLLASYGSNTISTTGNVSVGNIIGNGQALTGLTGANVSGQVGNALVASTVYTNAQPNITSVGTLTSLSVTGNANVGNLDTTTAIITTGNITTINSGLLQNGNSNITITSNGNVSIQAAGSTVELVVTSTGANVTGTLTSTGKIGYASGSTVTQTTNRGNGVTINALAGTIITTSASMVANQIDTFSVANDQVDPNNDIVLVQIVSPNFGVYNCIAQPSATISSFLNGFYINIQNISGFTTTSDAITIRFMVIKAPNA